MTVDTQVSGVHFQQDLDPARIARRLMAVNVSDIAAMGGQPTMAFLALSTAAGFDHRRFFSAFLSQCEKFRTILAGGDLSANTNTTIALTLLGKLSAKASWLRRDAALPGQDLWLGGTLGESALGLHLLQRDVTVGPRRVFIPDTLSLSPSLQRAARRAVRRHLLPDPQLSLGKWLAENHPFAAIDISDGLGRDLHRLCKESQVGALVEWDRIPLARSFRTLCGAIDLSWQDLVLSGGEDYVLLFTLPPGVAVPEDLGARRIGRMHKETEIYIRGEKEYQLLPASGWDHFSPTQK